MPRSSHRLLRTIRATTATVLGICVITVVAANGTIAFALPSFYLSSDTTAAGTSAATLFTAGLSNGFTVGTSALVNNSGDNYVAWAWAKGTTPGFDIETWTGNGTAGRTVSHSLGATPAFILFKRTDTAFPWIVYHQSTGNTGYTLLNSTNAAIVDVHGWNNTSPTSANITLGDGVGVNASGGSYIAYLWSEVPGFSKFGSYTGNGSTDGPFIYTGFKPKYIMVKRTDSTENWITIDTARDPNNPTSNALIPNLTTVDGANGAIIDSLANGFKWRESAGGGNVSSATYIYAAFADYPFERATTNQGYTIASSTRMNGTNTFLNRTPASNGSLTAMTFSTWLKLGTLSTARNIFHADTTGTGNGDAIAFGSGDAIGVSFDGGTYPLATAPHYRDPSSWQHLVVAIDTTQATAANRVKIYMNDVLQTVTGSYPPQNYSFAHFNHATNHFIGKRGYLNDRFFSGYYSDINFIDGQALPPPPSAQPTATVTGGRSPTPAPTAPTASTSPSQTPHPPAPTPPATETTSPTTTLRRRIMWRTRRRIILRPGTR